MAQPCSPWIATLVMINRLACYKGCRRELRWLARLLPARVFDYSISRQAGANPFGVGVPWVSAFSAFRYGLPLLLSAWASLYCFSLLRPSTTAFPGGPPRRGLLANRFNHATGSVPIHFVQGTALNPSNCQAQSECMAKMGQLGQPKGVCCSDPSFLLPLGAP